MGVGVMGFAILTVTGWWIYRRRRPSASPRSQETSHSPPPPPSETTPCWVRAYQPQEQPSPLEKLGPFRLESLLGKGGMASVYRAQDERQQRPVALKVILEELRKDREYVERFHREIQISRNLPHENLVEVYEAAILEGQLCMAMELVEGPSLEEILALGPLPLPEVESLARQLLAGLSFAHQKHLYHRDIKPANIMVTRQGKVKILDFGLAIEEGQKRLTHLGFAMGTPTHMAPEALTQGAADAKTDQYALGIVFFQMLTGQLPYYSSNPIQMGLLHVQQAPPPPSQLRPEIPGGWDQLVLRMLSKKPELRFPELMPLEKMLHGDS